MNIDCLRYLHETHGDMILLLQLNIQTSAAVVTFSEKLVSDQIERELRLKKFCIHVKWGLAYTRQKSLKPCQAVSVLK